jgi:hypothetical protein
VKHLSSFIAAALLLGAATPASAGEIFGGVYKHDVKLPTDLSGNVEHGMDLQLGWRGARIGHTPFQPYAFGALNTAGDTSYAAIGLSAKFGHAIFIRPGLGLAVHTGSASHYDIPGNDKIEFGSRVLFEPELGVGMQVAPRTTVEASWVHMSHATLFSGQNPGIDNLGVRVSVALP